jgi:nitroimidazol reductase NimA-like FMN-containing flavoprotein (pyridoxamine 5'-phosphate oxidase superfamily)
MERATREAVLQFVRSQSYAVEASSSSAGPQAAVVGFVVTDDFELFFDSVDSTRKIANLRKDPRIAFVIGGLAPGDERTVQIEGVADEPGGAELERLRSLYFTRFPDGRDRLAWPGLTYIRVRPTWLRFSDFSRNPPYIVELTLGPRTA